MLSNVQLAVRFLRKQPIFAVMAILTLALGSGANTAVFSVVYGVLLRELPYAHSSELAMLQLEARVPIYSKAEYLYLKDRGTSWSGVAAVGGGRGAVVVGSGQARSIVTSHISRNALAVLGTAPLLGRGFDSGPNSSSDQTIVISEQLWISHFNSDPNVVGQTLTLETRNGRSTQTVIGVLPQSLQLLHTEAIDVWFPLNLSTDLEAKNASLHLIARRRPGVSLESTQIEFSELLSRLPQVTNAYPADYQLTGKAMPLDEWVVGNSGDVLWLLLGASAFVLLIACANVSNLFLVRSSARIREFAVRMALGADRARISSLLLTESLVVAIVGGILGICLAVGTHEVLLSILPAELPRRDEIGLNGTVLFATLGLSILAAFVFALVPSWTTRRMDLSAAISSTSDRSGITNSAKRTQGAIVIVQMAMALVLTLGAGLMTRTVSALRQQDIGLTTHNVVSVELLAQFAESERLHGFFNDVFQRTRSLPGVSKAALTYHVPLSGSNSITTIRLVNHPSVGQDDSQTVGFQIVSDGYFDTMGIPLVYGESFSASAEAAASEIMVSEAFARTYWPGENPIGEVVIGSGRRRIVGVVGDTRHRGVGLPPRPEAYFPLSSFDRASMSLVVQTPVPVDAIAGAVRSEVEAVNPHVPITNVRLMDEIVATSFSTERNLLWMLGSFAFLALVLGAVGLYGVVAYTASKQRRELGIRLALGAAGRSVTGIVMGWGLKLATGGVALGVVLSFGLTRLLESQLFGVSHTDTRTLLLSVVVFTGVAATGAAIPAIRAAKIAPADVLKE